MKVLQPKMDPYSKSHTCWNCMAVLLVEEKDLYKREITEYVTVVEWECTECTTENTIYNIPDYIEKRLKER